MEQRVRPVVGDVAVEEYRRREMLVNLLVVPVGSSQWSEDWTAAVIIGAVVLVCVAWPDPYLAADRICAASLLLDGANDIDVELHEDEVRGVAAVPDFHEGGEASEVDDRAALLGVHDLMQVEVVVQLLARNVDSGEGKARGASLEGKHDENWNLQYDF